MGEHVKGASQKQRQTEGDTHPSTGRPQSMQTCASSNMASFFLRSLCDALFEGHEDREWQCGCVLTAGDRCGWLGGESLG